MPITKSPPIGREEFQWHIDMCDIWTTAARRMYLVRKEQSCIWSSSCWKRAWTVTLKGETHKLFCDRTERLTLCPGLKNCIRYFQLNLLEWDWYISIHISLKFIPKGLIDFTLVLVQVLAWRWIGKNPSLEPMITKMMSPYGATGL